MLTTIKRKVWRKLNPQTLKVVELVKPFTNAHGEVDMDRMDTEQKNWENQFPNRKFVLATLSRLKASGRLVHALNGGTEAEKPAATPNNGKKAWKRGTLTPLQKLITKIARKFGDEKGNIRWEAAFKHRPDWKLKLGGPDGKMARAYTAAFNLRKTGRLGGPVAATNGKHVTRTELGPQVRMPDRDELQAMVQARIADLLAECAHCPKCGKNLTALFNAASFEQTHHA